MGREERWGHCTGFKLVSQLKVEEGKVPLLQLETKTYFEFQQTIELQRYSRMTVWFLVSSYSNLHSFFPAYDSKYLLLTRKKECQIQFLIVVVSTNFFFDICQNNKIPSRQGLNLDLLHILLHSTLLHKKIMSKSGFCTIYCPSIISCQYKVIIIYPLLQ